MREEISENLTAAMKSRDTRRLATLRLMSAAIKERDIDARGEGRDKIGDEEILGLLQKMVRQREESVTTYAEAGRMDLAEQEAEEITIIREFLPQPLNEAEVAEAIAQAIEQTGAEGLRDMGKVVAALKAKYPGQIDYGSASKQIKAQMVG
jgi:hypothetical protein